MAVGGRAGQGDHSLTNDSQCNCYLTNGTQPAFLTNHTFFDFRNLAEYQGAPAIITNTNDSANAPASSSFFTTDAWTSVWSIQSWNNSNGARNDATVYMQNSPSNVYIEASTGADPSPQTWLTLRTQRLPDFQTAAEFESVSEGYQHLSMRMLARTVGSAGACTAMFTYRDGTPVQEADLEVRTRDPRDTVQYTNQPSLNGGGDIVNAATANATLPDRLDWTEWAVHRYDWTPGRSTWFVDGAQAATIVFQAPRDPAQLVFNAWSDGGEWTGNMSLEDAAYLQIQWLEMVYNTTDGKAPRRAAAGCRSVCSIDETTVLGTPVLISSSGVRSVGASAMAAWIPSMLVLVYSMSALGGLFQ